MIDALGEMWYTYGTKYDSGIENAPSDQDKPGQVSLNGTIYAHVHNLQGDIVGILDSSGALVVEYKYDAWGRVLRISGSMAETLGRRNPFRYRGYVYDEESGLYYLRSRYYDPEWGRFLTPDKVEYSFLYVGLWIKNLYAYCDNNSVVRVDYDGEFWDYIADWAFIAWGISDVINNPGDWKNWTALAVDAVFAVVPFVPSGTGQAIKAGNKIDNAIDIVKAIENSADVQDISKVTVIGRKMDRVTNTAELLGKTDELYQVWKGYDAAATGVKRVMHDGMSMVHDGAWLFVKLKKGYTVIDIGLPTTIIKKGLWYGTEEVVMNLWKTKNIWKFHMNYDFEK